MRRLGISLCFLFPLPLITSLKQKATGRLDKLPEVLLSKEENQIKFYTAYYEGYFGLASEATEWRLGNLRPITKMNKNWRNRNQM